MDFGSPETWRWIWLAAAVAFAVGEIAVAGSFFLLPFGIGAAAAALVALAGGSLALEWAAFVGVTVVCLLVLRPLSRRLDRNSPSHDAGAARWVGRQAHVLDEIPAGSGATGLIRLDREEWRAESLLGLRIRAGSTVLVSRVDGTRLIVVPLEEPPEDLEPPQQRS